MDQYCILCNRFVELQHDGYTYTLSHDTNESKGYVCGDCLSGKLKSGKSRRNCLYCDSESDYVLEKNKVKFAHNGEPMLAPQRGARKIICQNHFDRLQEDDSTESFPLSSNTSKKDADDNVGSGGEPIEEYDLFISHASEDKNDVARPLANELLDRGLDVWYDEFELSVGDSLTESIDYGLANSNYGVVILSTDFMNKDWTQRELRGLLSRDIGRDKIVLPIWYKVTQEEVMNFSPPLADKLAIKASAENIPQTAEKLYQEIKG